MLLFGWLHGSDDTFIGINEKHICRAGRLLLVVSKSAFQNIKRVLLDRIDDLRLRVKQNIVENTPHIRGGGIPLQVG